MLMYPSGMPPAPVLSTAGPPWVGAVVTIAILLSPAAIPQLTKSARKLLRPRRCALCLGVGNNICLLCKGRGKTGGLFTGVPLCKCSACKGCGRQLCFPCEGSGLSNRWLYSPVDKGAWGPRGS